MRHILVYLSPNGGTERAVKQVEKDLKSSHAIVQNQDLYRLENFENVVNDINRNEKKCVWFFTPVYVDHPLPQIVNIIEQLKENRNTNAVITATWGGVSSGLALYDMYEILTEKDIPVLGACKILAEHSSMWEAEHPLNMGKPDNNDLEIVSDFTNQILGKIDGSKGDFGIGLKVMDYQTEKMKKDANEKNLDIAKNFLPPKKADKDLCVKCGKCVEICPVFALRFNPYPEAEENCIMCNRCVKICPEDAYPYDHKAVEKRIKEMAENSDEPKTTEFFV